MKIDIIYYYWQTTVTSPTSNRYFQDRLLLESVRIFIENSKPTSTNYLYNSMARPMMALESSPPSHQRRDHLLLVAAILRTPPRNDTPILRWWKWWKWSPLFGGLSDKTSTHQDIHRGRKPMISLEAWFTNGEFSWFFRIYLGLQESIHIQQDYVVVQVAGWVSFNIVWLVQKEKTHKIISFCSRENTEIQMNKHNHKKIYIYACVLKNK